MKADGVSNTYRGQRIVFLDAETLEPLDSLYPQEIFEINSKLPIEDATDANNEVLEKMRELREPE